MTGKGKSSRSHDHLVGEARPGRWPAKVGTFVGVLAAIAQLIGTIIGDALHALIISIPIVLLGFPALLWVEQQRSHLKRQVRIPLVPALVLLLAMAIAGPGAGYLVGRAVVGVRTNSTGAGGGTTSPSTATSPGTIPASLRSMPLHEEITDNLRGTQVVGDPEGDAPAPGVPEIIKFNTKVQVYCWTENRSAEGSVNAFYLIGSGPWRGNYAPADTFANGDPVGKSGFGTAIDPAVPHCPSS